MGEIRSELTEADIIKLIDRQMNPFSLKEINEVINTFPIEDREEATLILLSLCQYGNLESLTGLGTQWQFSLSCGDLFSTIKYLGNKGFVNNKPACYDTPEPYLLDTALLEKLRTDSDFRNSILENQEQLYYLSSWLNGINPFNQANFSSAGVSIQEIMNTAKEIRRQDENIGLQDSILYAVDKNIKETLREIDPRLLDLLLIDTDKNIFNMSKSSEEKILERLSDKTITEEGLTQRLE